MKNEEKTTGNERFGVRRADVHTENSCGDFPPERQAAGRQVQCKTNNYGIKVSRKTERKSD
jgi:hypothetical protein